MNLTKLLLSLLGPLAAFLFVLWATESEQADPFIYFLIGAFCVFFWGVIYHFLMMGK